MRWDELNQENCSVARCLSVIGDRWTVMIIRNCFMGMRRFNDIQRNLGIAKPRLTERLNKLVEHEVLKKVQYQDHPVRFEYRLTVKGIDLYPVVMAMVQWGDTWLDEGKGAPMLYKHKPCGNIINAALICPHCQTPIQAREMSPMPGPGLLEVTV